MTVMVAVPYKKQQRLYTCGPTVLAMVLEYYQLPYSLKDLVQLADTQSTTGTTRKNLVKAAQAFDLTVHEHTGASFAEIQHFLSRTIPVVVNYRDHVDGEGHYGVVVGMSWLRILVHDPYHGKEYPFWKWQFMNRWYGFHRHTHRRWLMALWPKDHAAVSLPLCGYS